ncbi:hypothetical protein Bint_0531 [Brachyspira intermedia PWS/A]|uniref:Lipoprotein n=2 Tax=Brachyspira intermedia TaxID=84377 RepID=G0EJG3_BRAIP|nr:hypothetical protein Bint_0531 [Brachyspira intermedia PWS/A]
MLSISCSNKDKTGSSDGSATTTKGIEQYNGNTYVSSKIQINNQLGYVWISVKDSKVAIKPNEDNNTSPIFDTGNYFSVTGSGTDYNFSIPDSKQNPDSIVGTLTFSDDASYVTLNITKNGDDPTGETLNKHFVCNIKK